MKAIKVVCGIIYNDQNEILITRRKKGRHKGKWEFPGGKIEEGESPAKCLQREILEELTLDIRVEIEFYSHTHKYSNKLIVNLLTYTATLIGGNLTLIDHDQFSWVQVEELEQFDWLEGDIPIIKQLIERKSSKG